MMHIVTGVVLAVFLLSFVFDKGELFDNRELSNINCFVCGVCLLLLLLFVGHWAAVLLGKL